ncbi:MAG: phosphomannomutase/phosphoglucomutase, partial [Acutalibacteraceae bacterium]
EQLAKEGKTLERLIEDLVEPLEAQDMRIKILASNFKEYGNKVISEIEQLMDSSEIFEKAQDSYEGVRASIDKYDGWFLLRLSVHDPILPLNIESNVSGGVDKIKEKIKNILQKYESLDISSLN